MPRSVSFDVLANDKASQALASIAREVSQLDDRIDRAGGSIEVDAETAKAQDKLRQIDSQLARLNAKSLRVDADTAQAERKLQILQAELQKTTDADKQIELRADITQAQAQLRRLAAEKVSIDVDTGAAQAKVALLRANLDGIDKRKNTTVDVDAAGAFSKLAQLGQQLRGVQTPVTIAVGFAAVMQAVAWVERLAGGIASLGAVGVVSGGVAAAAFSGIGDAVQAMGEKATTGGGAVTASASAIRSATRQVESAQRDLRDANENVTRSEENLADAQKDAQRAVESLDDARRAAIRTLEDYELRSKGMALSQESADLAIAEAQQRLAEVEKDKNATSLERARAELSVREAIQRRNEIEVESTRLTEDKNAADKKGVEGSDQVVSANERIASANKRVQEAQRDLQKSHEEVTLAGQRLADSQIALREAMKPSGGGGTTVDKLAEAMKNLTPEGQAFVRFLRQLLDGPIKELTDESQSKFLPGLQDGIKSFMGQLDSAKGDIGAVATAFGDFFRDIGPSAGRAADAFLRLARLGAETTFDGLADGVNRSLDSFTEWANSQSAADITADIKDIGNSLVEMKNTAETSFRGLQLLWEGLKTAASFGNPFASPIEQIGRLYEAIRKFADTIPFMSGKLPPASELLKDLGNSGSVAVPQIDHVGTSADTTAGSLQRMQDAARQAVQQFASSEQASIVYAAAIDRANDAVKRNGETLNIHTQKGRDNRQALLDMAGAANNVIESMQNTNEPAATVTAAFQQQRQKLIEVAQQMGMTKAQAQAYIDKLLQIPASKTTNIIANTSAALSGIKAVSQAITELKDKTVNIRTVYSDGSVTTARAQAVGGWVPGSPSEIDTEHYMLAQGEFIVRSSQAKKWGPLLEQINDGRDPSTTGATNAGGVLSIPAQGGGGAGGGTAPIIVNVYVSNAVVGGNDEIARTVSTAVREGITRGYLPSSVLAGSGA